MQILGLFFISALNRTKTFDLAIAKLQIHVNTYSFKIDKRTLVQPQKTDQLIDMFMFFNAASSRAKFKSRRTNRSTRRACCAEFLYIYSRPNSLSRRDVPFGCSNEGFAVASIHIFSPICRFILVIAIFSDRMWNDSYVKRNNRELV